MIGIAKSRRIQLENRNAISEIKGLLPLQLFVHDSVSIIEDGNGNHTKKIEKKEENEKIIFRHIHFQLQATSGRWVV